MIRPVRTDDLDAVLRLAESAGSGLTNLPPDRHALAQRIASAERAIEDPAARHGGAAIMLVAELGEDIVATGMVFARVGGEWPFYSYRLTRQAAVSRSLGRTKAQMLLNLNNLSADLLRRAFVEDLYGAAAEALSPAAEIRWPSNRRGFGRGYWIGCAMQVRAMLHDCAYRLEHVAARPLPHGDVAVALRWLIVGTHAGIGAWGPPSGREVLLLAVSHYRLRDGAIVEDTTVFDEVAALRQIAGGLGA